MDRRQYLAAITGFAGTTLTGCATRRSPAGDGSTPSDESTLSAGPYTATLANPRVRASVRRGGIHVDVADEPDSQYLLFRLSTNGTALDDLPLSLHVDGARVDDPPMRVGRPGTDDDLTAAVQVPHGSYESASVVLTADGHTDRWTVPSDIVDRLGSAPSFTVESLTVPDSIPEVRAFDASFTVSNSGEREARFLAEFGHGLISDIGEVALPIPAGETRTHRQQIHPPDGDYETIPVELSWGLDHRRVEVSVANK